MATFDRNAFIRKFQEEATEHLQRLNEGVILLEGDPENRPLIDQMLRDAHTLKGSSRMVGLLEISDIAHRLEDLMVSVREGQLRYSADLSDGFFEALDAIVYLCDRAGGDTSALDVPALLGRLEAMITPAVITTASEVSPASSEARGADAAPEARATAAEVPGPAAGQSDDDALQPRTQATVRVRTDQVDRMLNLVSEVVIAEIKSSQRARDLRSASGLAKETGRLWSRIRSIVAGLPAEHAEVLAADIEALDNALAEQRAWLNAAGRDYTEDTARTASVVADLQEHAMAMRMLPVSSVTSALPRAVRDLAKQFGKDVKLVVEGGDTELDRKVLEELNDPLVHIVRNAIDHGIEPPKARSAVGKPERGTVRLTAHQEGDRIVIEVSDDGAGIDPARVRDAAVRRGYLSAEDADALSDRQAMYLIFEPGFTTSTIITELSGRGVGMDIVREFVVEKLHGALDLESVPGEGTTFRLTIPLTLALIRALLVRVDGQTFAIPTVSVTETLRIDPVEVLHTEGREVIRRQRRSIPLTELADVLGLPAAPGRDRKMPVVVVGLSGQRAGLVVDELLGEQQIVIKALGSHLKRVETIAGVTIMGAGEVVPILDVADLLAGARELSGARSRRRQAPAARPTRPRRVLICEDSFTTRELERSIFEAAGYVVETAGDGAAGLARLRAGLSVDAVVSDVQMPNMTGFELASAIKADDGLRHIPVVIVTSLERPEEKAEGIEAGADAYITKSVFNQDTLLDTVDRLIGPQP